VITDAESAPNDDPQPGGSIGPYRLVRLLGRGGMGDVFLAEDTRLGRRVAVKTLRPKLTESAHFTTHLLREARATARLNHPNIAQIYDVVPADGRMHIVMEHLDGETLAERLRRSGPLPAGEAAAFGVQIAAALEHAHGQGILHCDMKPGNVFVTTDGTIKVLDFGLARVLDAETGAPDLGVGATPTLLEMRAGTPAYMSPEQQLGRHVDQRSDIYSVGLVLQELCSGRPSVPRSLDHDTTRTTTAAPPDPSIAAPLRAIIARTTSLSPQERYESAATLKEALQAATAELSSLRPRSWLRPKRHVVIPVVAALAIVGFALAYPRLRSHDPVKGAPGRPPVLAIVPFAASDASAETRYLAAGLTELLTDSLSISPALVVVSNSAMRAAGAGAKAMDVVSRELGADYVVGGGLQPQGGKVLVSLTVFHAATKRSESAGVFETTLPNVITDSRALADVVRQRLRDAGVPVSTDTGGQAPVTSRAALEDYAQGRELLERFRDGDNLDKAIALFTSSIKRDQAFALAHAALGEASWRKYRLTLEPQWATRARDAAFDALRRAPDEARVRYTAGVILRGTGRKEEAAEELRKAVKLQPNYVEAHRLLGTVLAEDARLDEAVAEFESALNLQPASPETYHSLGLAYFDHGKFEQAVQAFTKETELRPDRASAFQALGASYHSLGKPDEAVRNYNKAIAIVPSALAFSNIGLIHYSQRRYRDAVDAYRQSATLEPNVPETHRNLADSLAKFGDRSGADRSYEHAIALADKQLNVNSRDGKLFGLRGVCLAKLRRTTEARAAASSAVAFGPSDGEVQYLAAVTYALTGELDQAVRLTTRALELGFSRSHVEGDEDLAAVRSTKAFKALPAR
jgi:eukaryotic-like serine/threonine-protein kinase